MCEKHLNPIDDMSHELIGLVAATRHIGCSKWLVVNLRIRWNVVVSSSSSSSCNDPYTSTSFAERIIE
jgi:hypothetical protein